MFFDILNKLKSLYLSLIEKKIELESIFILLINLLLKQIKEILNKNN